MLNKLRNRFMPFVIPDEYAEKSSHVLPEYTVRSIYLDTRYMECHEEKTEGVELRKKFRIRSYNQYNPESVAILEIKRKIENRIKKHRAFTKVKNIETLMETADIYQYVDNTNDSLDDASRFFFNVKKRQMNPTVLVVYEREAYHGRIDQGVRITFDKNIRSYNYPQYKDLFNKEGLRHLFPTHFILEIKYFSDRMPLWAKSIVQEFRLRNDALSKYAIGYDVNTRHNIFTY